MRQKMIKFLPFLIMVTLLSFGCAGTQGDTVGKNASPVAAEQKMAMKVYKGKIMGKSNKAKTISISVGKGKAAKTMMVRFDDKTKGVEHAVKGHAAIIKYEMRGDDQVATVIKPKLAKLPQGVTEIKTEEMQAIIAANTPMFLVDSRPASRYAQSHLPGAVSIPVPKLKKNKATLLAKDKDLLHVFYCGGPT